MNVSAPSDVVNPFRSPKEFLSHLDPEVAASLITAAADIAIVIDQDGIIRDIAFGSEDLSRENFGDFVGRAWIDTVTIESRPKIKELLKASGAKSAQRWRQVNHPSSSRGTDIPVRYCTVPIGTKGRLAAIGRDLRSIAGLQQRLVDAQQSMEREYARIRHAETRYRLLFQVTSEAVIVVEAPTHRVVEANPSAQKLLARPAKKLAGSNLIDLFEPNSQSDVEELLNTVRNVTNADEIRARLAVQQGGEVLVSASLVRQGDSAHFLMRLTPLEARVSNAMLPRAKSKALDVIDAMPDGFVLTSLDRRILSANAAFLDMSELATEEQLRGELIERWVGRTGVDMSVLVANLREHGTVRHFGTVVRGEYGATEDVEISAVMVSGGDEPCLGFTIRNVGRRLAVLSGRKEREMPKSVEQLTELVGRVSLKELVRETTDIIEKLCIEAALELTNDNRASAAEMLGLSRQSFYVKLRRFGLGDIETDSPA